MFIPTCKEVCGGIFLSLVSVIFQSELSLCSEVGLCYAMNICISYLCTVYANCCWQLLHTASLLDEKGSPTVGVLKGIE